MAYNQLLASASGSRMKQVAAFLQVAIIVIAGLLPLLLTGRADAATLTSRSVTIDKSAIGTTSQGQNVQYDFDFTTTSNATIQGIIFEFCDAPLGTCTLPTGMNVDHNAVTLDSDSGFQGGANAFSEFTTDNTGDCDDIDGSSDDTMYCIVDTDGGSTTAGALSVDLGGITNPTSVTTVYIRIALYSDADGADGDDFAPADIVHNGTVAAAIVDQLTINGRVQERLNFCVAAMDEDDVEPVSVAACTALTDSNVDIGVIDDSSIAISPVEPTATNGSDDDFGILMVNTNASGGAVVGYFPENASSVNGGDTDQLKSFRVVPTNCDASASSVTDQCFVSASNAGPDGDTITNGAEKFGVYVPCIFANPNNPSATTANLTGSNDVYDGSDETVSGGTTTCESETFDSGTGEIGWNTTASADTLVSSTNVVDDEIVKLRFAATASSTTPTGAYTVVTTYIATVTF